MNLERDQSTTSHNKTNIMGKKKQIINHNTTIKVKVQEGPGWPREWVEV
jgi:hypothetical protein